MLDNEPEHNAQRYIGKYVKQDKTPQPKVKTYELPRINLITMPHHGRAPHRKGAI